MLGICHDKQGDKLKAMQHYKQCLTRDQNHFHACTHLATILHEQGENARAEKYFRHSVKLRPKDLNALTGLCNTL